MDLGLLGVYWRKRGLTLGGYKGFLSDVLLLLRAAHPAFCEMYWVGDGKRQPVKIATEMNNLDELVYRYSWGKKKDVRGERNPDGTPTWASENAIGFDMVFNTGKSSKKGGITISVHAGDGGSLTPNVITISFPAPTCLEFAYREFYAYDFVLNLLVKIIRFTAPETGLVTSHDFATSIYGDGPFDIGWLTYFADDRCAPLTKQFSIEKSDVRGTLFSLGERAMFVNSEETVSLGRSLRDALKQAEVLR